MQLRTRTWFLISLLCLAGAVVFWHLGNRYEERRRQQRPSATTNALQKPEIVKELGALNYAENSPLTHHASGITNDASRTTNHAARATNAFAYRLSNTSKTIGELIYSDNALLLRNALIDTAAQDQQLAIPEHLRAEADPGAYIVQATGPTTDAFRSYLAAAGAEIVSYIPNNAYLVRMNEEGAAKMRSYGGTRTVVPWEPYYKIDPRLLPAAVNNKPLPEGVLLTVVLFPGQRDSVMPTLTALGVRIELEQKSPFGHQLTVLNPNLNLNLNLAQLARLPAVQAIEPYARRVLANDLGRPRVSSARDSITNVNHLDLTGSGVQVAVVDTGVDPTHGDLENRVFGLALGDAAGHGTHVAGTIAGSGVGSPTVSTNPPPPGSTNRGANFRGVAPQATIFSMPIDTVTGPLFSEVYLQEQAVLNTNYIVNNSWGYGNIFEYDFSAASYDAAVRDALSGEPGQQPLVMVFAAGNAGDGSGDGSSGSPDSITSPATAKNVITVGAMETLRRITNEVTDPFGFTNRVFLGGTDSDDQVAGFSSRGNVGIGLEGTYGRFKPDLVAPGTFIISCRSSNWVDPSRSVGTIVGRLTDQDLENGETNFYSFFVPNNGEQLGIRILPSQATGRVASNIQIYASSTIPTPVDGTTLRGTNQAFFPVTPGEWSYALYNPGPRDAFFDIQTILFITNDTGNFFQVLSNLNAQLAPEYRYESGTSMAAGFVSGSLALMHEFFSGSAGSGFQQTNSPALMKALLINGARSLACALCPEPYNFHPNNIINYQGWGLINLTNSVPPALAQTTANAARPLVFYDQSATDALATGESHTRNLKLNRIGQVYPLRVTLVWTDPPGNPAASVKLVNDLDLVVTNKRTGEFYIGNNFPPSSDFTAASITNSATPLPFDVVNNVENVYINSPLADDYDIVVRARRVNVNAVTTQTNGILQDYALVISSGNSGLGTSNNPPFSSIQDTPTKSYQLNWTTKNLTNQQPLLNERVGANNPLRDPAPNEGSIDQWNFYIFARSNGTNWGTNVAIATFLPPNASLARNREADIDLYVSTNPDLTNLNASVLADAAANRNNSWSSRTRLGSESVILPGFGGVFETFYVAVKAEDQQAADFGIFAVASDFPMGDEDADGNISLFFFPMGPTPIPDGSPERPGGMFGMAFVANPKTVRRIVLENTVTHENAGDLIGYLTHDTDFAVLHNHRTFAGISEYAAYDDSTEEDIPGTRGTDGPGSLNDFQGKQAQGAWTYVMADNAPFQTGAVLRVFGRIEPQDDLTNSVGLLVQSLEPSKWRYFALDVPVGVTNLTASVYNIQPPNPLDLYLRRGARPNPDEYDKYVQIGPNGGSLSCSIYDDPPLVSGRYIIGVSNPSSATVSFRIRVDYQYSLAPIGTDVYTRSPSMALLDDAITNDVITVTNEGNIADVKVGVRIDHPRLSDLVLHLVSPQGTRVLLAENRGGLYAPVPNAVTNLGLGSPTNYVVPFASTGDDAEFSTNLTVTADGNAILQIDYEFFRVPDSITVYCGARPGGFVIFRSGYISGSGTLSVPLEGCSDIELVINEGVNPAPGTLWRVTVNVAGPWNYATFTDNPNLGGMYKFENPPFFGPITNYVVLTNSFENAGDTTGSTNVANYGFPPPFANGEIFEDWRVFSNGVAVITETNFVTTRFNVGTGLISVTNPVAFHGTNYLALSHGQVSLPLTNLVADREYILTFAYRKISSAATQQVAIGGSTVQICPFQSASSIPGNADILYYVRSNLPSAGPPIPMPKLRVCPGQDVRITAGNVVTANGTGYGPEGDTNPTRTNAIGPLYSLIGCWSSHPCRLDPQTIVSSPFYVGASNIVHAPTAPGDYYLFLGVNSELFDATDGFHVTNEWQQCQYADAHYALGSTARPLVGEFYWQREKLRFIANQSVTNLVLRTNINTTMIFDDFRIEEPVSTIYYQSEEPMTPLHGELALGDWRLEIWDNRAGPVVAAASTNATGSLYSWALTFIYGEAVPPIPLTNGVDYIGRVRGEEIKYFRVAVPLEVQGAANYLTSISSGSGLELLYSPFGLPRGDGTDPVAIPEAAIPLILDANIPPGATLPFGRNYFLGVRNFDPGETNTFAIRAEFDVPVTPLVNGVNSRALTITANPNPLAAQKDNSLLSVPFMQYWYFDVTNGAHSAKFEVITNHLPLNPALHRNLNMVVKRALPVVDLFPTPFNYDYQATEANPSLHDLIFVNSNSMPIKLGPGRWYLGVYNFETNRIRYQVRATQSDQALFTYTNLVDGVSSPFTNAGPGQLTNFFRFVVGTDNAADQTNAAVLFEICEMDGDVDLLVKRSDLPSSDLYDFSFLVRNASPNFGGESLPIRTNLFIPHLSATNWWIGIIARDDGPLTGTIRATTFTNINPIVGCVFNAMASVATLPSGAPALALSWNAVPQTRYQPEVSVNFNTWTSLGPVVTPRTTSGTVMDTNLNSGSLRFYRIRAVP